MSDQPGEQDTHEPGEQPDAREPDDSPQRRLVESVAAYEVDPPPPARATAADPGAPAQE